MKKITVIVLFLLFFSPSLFAQSKYLIFFADKGVSESQSLEKSSSIYQMAFESLSKESIDRRKKVLGEDNFILYEDLPINKKYVDNISSLGIEVIYELKWFNAISAFLTDENIQQLSSFSFIKKIEPVRKFVQKEPKISKLYPIANRPIKSAQSDSLDYGLSEKQLLLSDIP
ncbi:MAG: hypothetical protein K9G34_05980, partial [Melioribacteraceae bacterium]|nr:hypothetical protein [Melioribacteraceae bacterium]